MSDDAQQPRRFVVDPLKHQGLVVAVALKHLHRGMELDDLIQEGQFGLLTACEEYDETRGVKFSEYAQALIKYSIREAIKYKGRMIRIPAYLQAEMLGWTKTRVRPVNQEFLRAAEKVRAMRSAPFVGDGVVVVDGQAEIVTGENESSPVANRDEVEFLLSKLEPAEATILRLRYGLDNHREMYFEEIGFAIGKHAETARTTHDRAIRKLKKYVGVPA